MDIKAQSTVDRVYEDYEPYYEWDKDEGRFTFMIPGYRRDQLRIQVTSKPALWLKGERQIIDNRWRRFNVEFPIPSDYDLDSVSAKFDGGSLHVKFAKLVKSKETTKPPEEETSRPKEEPSQKVDQQNAAQGGTPKAKEDKAEAKTNNEVADQKTPQNEKEKQPSDEKEKTKTETADSIEKEAKKEDKTNKGITKKKEAATSKAPATKDAKPIKRFNTRILDFTPGLGPSNQVYNEELKDLDAGPTKRKRLVNCGLLTLLVVGLGLYAKNKFIPSHGGSKFEEL